MCTLSVHITLLIQLITTLSYQRRLPSSHRLQLPVLPTSSPGPRPRIRPYLPVFIFDTRCRGIGIHRLEGGVVIRACGRCLGRSARPTGQSAPTILGVNLPKYRVTFQNFRGSSQNFRDRKSTRLNSSHLRASRMPSSA